MSKIDEKLKERLTDRETAAGLRKNIEGLLDAGMDKLVSIMDISYVKLAEYENREEELNRLYSDLIDCPRAGAILTSREMDYIEDNDENYE